jgi:two-component system CheB/CheR fusion protein
VSAAFDGTAGVAMASKNVYDVVICDIGLPGMDGYEVVKQLRLNALKPAPCCIALTGYNQQESRARAIEAGFDHYLVKPMTTEILLNLISSNAAR